MHDYLSEANLDKKPQITTMPSLMERGRIKTRKDTSNQNPVGCWHGASGQSPQVKMTELGNTIEDVLRGYDASTDFCTSAALNQHEKLR